MNKFKSLFFYSFLVISLLSCQSNEDTNNNDIPSFYVDSAGRLIDGGEVSHISLYCDENKHTIFGLHPLDYFATTKTVKDYDAFRLLLYFHLDRWQYTSNDEDEMKAIKTIEFDYNKSKAMFIYEDYQNKRKANYKVEWPDGMLTCYINGEVSITCDKVLYGEQPGANLSSHFTVLQHIPCLPIGVEAPRLLYSFGDEIPNVASELFVKGTWLLSKYYMQFLTKPAEKYDELTLYITLPVITESMRDIAVAKYKGIEPASKYTESVLKAECKIKFNWE